MVSQLAWLRGWWFKPLCRQQVINQWRFSEFESFQKISDLSYSQSKRRTPHAMWHDVAIGSVQWKVSKARVVHNSESLLYLIMPSSVIEQQLTLITTVIEASTNTIKIFSEKNSLKTMKWSSKIQTAGYIGMHTDCNCKKLVFKSRLWLR